MCQAGAEVGTNRALQRADEAYVHWDGDGCESCVCIDGRDEYDFPSRAAAAVAMHGLVGKWIAENA